MSPAATPEPLSKTWFVRKRDSGRLLVKVMPVEAGDSKVKPGLVEVVTVRSATRPMDGRANRGWRQTQWTASKWLRRNEPFNRSMRGSAGGNKPRSSGAYE